MCGSTSWSHPAPLVADFSCRWVRRGFLLVPRSRRRSSPADQLRAVMEHVLSVAVRELTKIVEASFDDLLLEITKMETEQQVLEERLSKTPSRGGRGGGGGWRRGSENDSVSPSGSEDARVDPPEVTSAREVGREGECLCLSSD